MIIHILGPSGSGTTTLGNALHTQWGYIHLDADDYFWLPTNPPYTDKRPVTDRQQLLKRDMIHAKEKTKWCVITGSLTGWGDVIIPLLDVVVYLWVPMDIRIHRLRMREQEKFGVEALLPGGIMHKNHEAFILWASQYDSGGLDMRSRATHEAWLAKLVCPILRIEGEVSLTTSVGEVGEFIEEIQNRV